ncbi:MAG: cation transporter [Pseudomonadota bacterium]
MLKHLRSVVVGAAMLTMASAIAGQPKTVMLDVDGMTCEACPLTVKKALKRLNGVVEVDTKYEGKGIGWAKVTYDPDKTKLDDLTFATTEAGYPSKVHKN